MVKLIILLPDGNFLRNSPTQVFSNLPNYIRVSVVDKIIKLNAYYA